jgi:hypothetical protein
MKTDVVQSKVKPVPAPLHEHMRCSGFVAPLHEHMRCSGFVAPLTSILGFRELLSNSITALSPQDRKKSPPCSGNRRIQWLRMGPGRFREEKKFDILAGNRTAISRNDKYKI